MALNITMITFLIPVRLLELVYNLHNGWWSAKQGITVSLTAESEAENDDLYYLIVLMCASVDK